MERLPFTNGEAIETRRVLKQASEANRYLAELKGVAQSMPNEAILISTLTLQEAKDSSEVENIITTHDELYKVSILADGQLSPAAKEVRDYAIALRQGFEKVKEKGLIRLQDVIQIQATIEHNNAGLRRLPGTALRNQRTNEVVYTPPQGPEEIEQLMANLINYINDSDCCDLDPLVKMALIHHQFESIHPFYDGNGRTGRILNVLYLVVQGLQDLPVLYLSRYIIRNKPLYYQYLQEVRDNGAWEEWVLFVLKGVSETAQETITLINQIKSLMMDYKHRMRVELPSVYSQELLNNLFKHPYTKIDFVMQDLSVSRITATKYLDQLAAHGFVIKEKVGRSNYYINQPLFELLADN